MRKERKNAPWTLSNLIQTQDKVFLSTPAQETLKPGPAEDGHKNDSGGANEWSARLPSPPQAGDRL
jgi:hypothetical protein